MSKFIGLICAWGVENWIELAITQALSFCDEVIVSVGAHCEGVKKYEDKTLEICKSFGDKIKLVGVEYTGQHNTTKAYTMNAMLKSSEIFDVGNWVFLLDVDEFYHKTDIENLKTKIEDYNSVMVCSKIFIRGMKQYVKGEHYRMWKITNKDCDFRPTNRWTGETNPQYKSEHIMFHYTFLLDPNMKMDFWKEEYAGKAQNEKVDWMKNVYLKDVKFTLGPHDFGYGETLYELQGKHPDIIEKSKL